MEVGISLNDSFYIAIGNLYLYLINLLFALGRKSYWKYLNILLQIQQSIYWKKFNFQFGSCNWKNLNSSLEFK